MKPVSLSLRVYNVGFGDCFLLGVHYAPNHRRMVLIDFGGLPLDQRRLLRVAHDIRRRCLGKLHAVVASHPHADHINGFAGLPGAVIASCRPELVIQPWTMHPDAAPDALAPPPSTDTRLSFLAAVNASNRPALEALNHIGRACRYVHFGADSGLDELLPGVKVSVLGPPTLEQTSSIRKQRSKDPDEFWHLAPEARAAGRLPAYARWFARRLSSMAASEALEVVRLLDAAINNTSVILLIEAAGRKLLFPGDAQMESWSFALAQPGVRRMLAGVDLYKVGHHGSLNATPKSLWRLLDKRRNGFTSVLSTRSGLHGDARRGTEVPRRALVAELARSGRLINTDQLGNALYVDL